MKVITTIEEMKAAAGEARKLGKTIGFVPTMGYLHQGHLSLIEGARRENDVVVVSIFVNPAQFGVNEDFNVYPRNLERDMQLTEEAGVDLLFHPEIAEMYPNGYETFVEVNEITSVLCGASRPGHFKGVTTVVSKLFNIVSPHRAYFGLKDAQQVVVLKQMVKDLNMNVELVPCPIVREADGLAMSSRNVNLSDEERKAALVLSKSLWDAKKMIEAGERNAAQIRQAVIEMISSEPLMTVDYVEVVDFNRLAPVKEIKDNTLIALAAKVGKVRLIDNLLMEA